LFAGVCLFLWLFVKVAVVVAVVADSFSMSCLGNGKPFEKGGLFNRRLKRFSKP